MLYINENVSTIGSNFPYIRLYDSFDIRRNITQHMCNYILTYVKRIIHYIIIDGGYNWKGVFE